MRYGEIEIREIAASGSAWTDATRPCAHLILASAGTITDKAGERVELIRPGDVLFHPPGTIHTTSPAEPESTGWIVAIGSALLTPLHAALGNAPQSIRASAYALQHLPERFLEELAVEDAISPVLLQTLIVEILCRVFRAASGLNASPRPRWLVQAVRRIESDYSTGLTPGVIAREVGVSPARLREGLRKWYRCTFAELLRERRVRAAVRLLESGRPLRDIATECGFYDQAHFTRAFQSVRGVSPYRYRNRIASRG